MKVRIIGRGDYWVDVSNKCEDAGWSADKAYISAGVGDWAYGG